MRESAWVNQLPCAPNIRLHVVVSLHSPLNSCGNRLHRIITRKPNKHTLEKKKKCIQSQYPCTNITKNMTKNPAYRRLPGKVPDAPERLNSIRFRRAVSSLKCCRSNPHEPLQQTNPRRRRCWIQPVQGQGPTTFVSRLYVRTCVRRLCVFAGERLACWRWWWWWCWWWCPGVSTCDTWWLKTAKRQRALANVTCMDLAILVTFGIWVHHPYFVWSRISTILILNVLHTNVTDVTDTDAHRRTHNTPRHTQTTHTHADIVFPYTTLHTVPEKTNQDYNNYDLSASMKPLMKPYPLPYTAPKRGWVCGLGGGGRWVTVCLNVCVCVWLTLLACVSVFCVCFRI